ncbi:hypothetical protein [Leptospira santarosai]|uniref:hypothetical protein n=1 Tax=Leptospira santarosai TaxID=28183 RepID=UPI000518DCD9|nr:hypothetical protein [Leptospira santarosai]
MVIENEERNFFHCRTIFRYQVVIPDNDLDEINLNHKLKISDKDSYIKLFRDNKILSITETIAGAILFPITITFGDWPYCKEKWKSLFLLLYCNYDQNRKASIAIKLNLIDTSEY